MILNFGQSQDTIPIPKAGSWAEQIDGALEPINVTAAGQAHAITVPSNYGLMSLL